MNRQTRFVLFLAFAATVILFLNDRINRYDLRFYFGKDNGDLARLGSTCLLGAVFFVVMGRGHSISQMLAGFVTGLCSGIVCYFAVVVPFNGIYTGLIFQALSCLSFILIFFLIEKKRHR